MQKYHVLLLSCSLLVLVNNTAFSQNAYKPGYVLNNSADTLWGEILDNGYEKMRTECTFRLNPEAADQLFTPNDIQAFRFIDGKYFVTKTVRDTLSFMELLIKGELNVYFEYYNEEDLYWVESDDKPFKLLSYGEFSTFTDRSEYRTQSTKHVGILKYYTSDAPDIMKKAERIERPNRVELIRLAKEYHNTVCSEYECLIYEGKEAVQPIYLGVTSMYLHPYDDVGVLLHGPQLYLPSSRKNALSAKLGLLYTSIDDDLQTDYKDNLFIIPVIAQYNITRWNVKPKFDLGILQFIHVHNDYYYSVTATYPVLTREIKENRYKKFSTSIYAGTGINWDITKKIVLNFDIGVNLSKIYGGIDILEEYYSGQVGLSYSLR